MTAQASKAQAISPLAIRERTGSLSTAEIFSVLKGELTSLRIRQDFSIKVAKEITASFVVPVSGSAKMAFLNNMAAHLTAGKAQAAITQMRKMRYHLSMLFWQTWWIRSAGLADALKRELHYR